MHPVVILSHSLRFSSHKLYDPHKSFLAGNAARAGDSYIISEVKKRLSTKAPVKVLELAGGVSRNDGEDLNYRSFELSRHLKFVYREMLSLVVSDINSTKLDLDLFKLDRRVQPCCYVIMSKCGKELGCLNSTIGGRRTYELPEHKIDEVLVRNENGGYSVNIEAEAAIAMVGDLTNVYLLKFAHTGEKISLKPVIDPEYEARFGIEARGEVDLEKLNLNEKFDVIYVRHHYCDSIITYNLKSTLDSLSPKGVFLFEQDGKISLPLIQSLEMTYPRCRFDYTHTPKNTTLIKVTKPFLKNLFNLSS